MKTLLLFFILVVLLALCFHRHSRAGDDFDRDEIFTFQALDRRDPFSFTREIPKVMEPLNPVVVDPVDVQKLDPARVAQKRMEALTQYNLAEQSFMEENAPDTLAHCDKGLEVFHDVEVQKYRELQDARDQIMRLRKAAERAKIRSDVEREFSMLNIKVTGIVSRDRAPQAIINSVVVGKGDVVNEAVVISDILPGSVTVMYRGFRLSLTIQR